MTNFFRKYLSLYSSTANTFATGEGVTITPASVVGLPTDTEITLTFDRVDSSGLKTPSKMERIRGTVTGGNFVISASGRAVEGTEQTHTSPVVEMIVNANDWNGIVNGVLVAHEQTGIHKSGLTLTSPKINEDVALTATATQLNAQILATNDGWTLADESWAYASATTITVPTGAASRYAKGDKIKLTQTTVKYFYVVGVADTVLTVTGGSDYTVANAAITLNYYSHAVSPVGFPAYFWWTPNIAYAGYAQLSAYTQAFFSIIGTMCFVHFTADDKSIIGTADKTLRIGLPVLPVISSSYWGNNAMYISGYVHIRAILLEGGTIDLQKDISVAVWSATETGVFIRCTGSYNI